MPTSAIILGYQERIISLHAAASQLRIGQLLALLFVVAAVIAIGVLSFVSIAKRTLPAYAAVLPAPILLYAERIRRQRAQALLETLRLEAYYQRGLERMEGRWVGTGVAGDEYAPAEDHPYAKDLHLFGDGSLFQFLCTCRTDVGRRHLAQTFLATPSLDKARGRQAAVRELRDNVTLREKIQLLGDYSFQEASAQTLGEWLDFPVVTTPKGFRAILGTISLCILSLFVAERLALLTWQHMVAPMSVILMAGGALALLYRERVLAAQPGIRALSLELPMLRQGLALLETQQFQSPLLREMVETVAGSAAQLRRLERLTKWMAERDREWFYHPSRALILGTQLFLTIEAWRSSHAAALRRWLPAWGEFETLMALATYAAEHPQNSFPEFADQETALLECEKAAHPLLPRDVCVQNDIAWNEQTRFYVVSGSNMAGKSTLLRTIGLNAVLAYAGAPVCAARMLLSRLWICASISIQDSLLNGKSKFMAEVERLKQALSVEPQHGVVLFLIDEILSGTNSLDRRSAAEAILRSLLEKGGIGAISTHDLALTELASMQGWAGANVHMGSRQDADPLDFDYLLKPGVTRQSSALAIARLAGVRL